MAFSFSFSGNDIEKDADQDSSSKEPISTTTTAAPQSSAFPIPGKPQLPATEHCLSDLLSSLPSKIAFNLLEVSLDEDGGQGPSIQLPRRELWDVRMQIMAEDDEMTDTEEYMNDGGLGKHDVRTGIYEGGFKSWESSVDLVKVLAAQEHLSPGQGDGTSILRSVELGCGTALPSLALFQWIMTMDARSQPRKRPCSLVLADYNPLVLRLVTLPNFLLAWALHDRQNPVLRHAFDTPGELELSPEILSAFQHFLAEKSIELSLISGAWSPEFVKMLWNLPAFAPSRTPATTLLLGSETIYSPFALRAFTEILISILEREQTLPANQTVAYVAAKRLYFGVGGSLDDFVHGARERGAIVTQVREETDGVRRGVVECVLPSPVVSERFSGAS